MTTSVANRTLLQEKENVIRDILQNLHRWEEIKDHGCCDPFWSDGVNMNLTRNHIIYDKRRLLELCEALQEPLPEEYYLPLPPEVDNNYLCKDGEYFAERKKRMEQRGDIVILNLPKVKNTGQTELF